MKVMIMITQGNRGKSLPWTLVRPRTKTVETNRGNKVNLLWYQQGQTNRMIPNNNSDNINYDKEKWTCLSLATISGDRNVIKKESEKILNCQRFTKDTGRTRNVKTKVIPVITETTGTTSKSFRKYLSNITVKHNK